MVRERSGRHDKRGSRAVKKTQKKAVGAGLGSGVLFLVLVAACGPKAPPLTELSAAELWNRGANAFAEEEWSDAIRYLDRFVIVGGSDPRVNQARYYVGQAHFERRQYVTASAEFTRLAGDLGTSDLADDARFMACRSYEQLSPDPQLDQQYTRAAIDHCQSLLDYFPDSMHREEATRIVAEMWDKLARKVFETGDWYQGRRAYDSAILYYEDLVQSYPATAWAPRALDRLLEIYGILEWEEERNEVRQRLLTEYPDSPAAQALGAG